MPAVNIDRKAFARLAVRPDLEKLKAVVRDARRNDRAAREEMLGALTWVAFSCPGATDPVYDLIATTWLDVADAPTPEIEPGIAEAPLGAAFWDAYWQVIAGAEEGYDASTITAAVASLGGALDECFGEIAEELGLGVAGKKDSQEICFVTQGHHSDFVRAREPEKSAETSGEIITTDGEIVGEHAGYEAFTIGQRKGLGVAMGTPFFVTEINPNTNQVVIGSKEQLAKPGLTANDANWLVEPTDLPRQVSIQIRYNAPPQPAQIIVDPDDQTRFSATFEVPQLAVAPGQAAVVYDESRVLGGGWIE